MKYFVVEPLTVKTVTGDAIFPIGKVLELNREQAGKMGSKIEMVLPLNDGKDLPHYCSYGGCHCSQKLPTANYPSGCGACEYLPVAR